MTQANGDTPRRSSAVPPGLAVFLGFLGLTVILYALPILGDFSTSCVGRCVPDTSLYVWSMRWMPYAVGHGLDPLFSEIIWAPEWTNLAWVTSLPGPALVMSPFTAIFGPVVSVNVLMLLAPTLAAWATFLLAREVTGRVWPSVAGAAVFGYSTYMAQHMRSHLNLLLIFFVPLAVYLVLRHVRGRMRSVTFVILLSLVLIGQFSVSSEVFATLTLFGGIAFLLALGTAATQIRRRLLRTGLFVGAAYAVTVVAISPFLLKALGNAPAGPIRPLEKNSVDLVSFLVPRRTMLIGGDTFAAATADLPGKPWDDTAYLGPGLLLVAIAYAWERRRDRSAWALIGFAVVVAVLATGPVLHVDGNPTIPMPGRAVAALPLIQHALPERFPAYLFLALALISARWIAGAEMRTPWIRYAAVAIGVALLLPTQIASTEGRDLRIPPFFTEDIDRRYVAEGENVLVIPRKLGEELLWQAEADMSFRLARAYVGPLHPGDLPGLGPLFSTGRGGFPSEQGLRRFLDARGVGVVIVEEPVDARVRALFEHVIDTPPRRIAGVSVYQVPERAPVG